MSKLCAHDCFADGLTAHDACPLHGSVTRMKPMETATSVGNLKHLSEVKAVPDERVVKGLEQMLERAKSGEIRGFVAFVNLGAHVTSWQCGEGKLNDTLAAYEDWKFTQLAARNLKCGTCGNEP